MITTHKVQITDMNAQIRDRGRKPRYPALYYERAEEMLNTPGGRVSAKSIEAELVREFGADKVPTERAISGWIKDGRIRRIDPSELWSLAGATGAEAALVLPVLRYAAETTDRPLRRFTRSEAEWIVRIRQAAPDVPLAVVLERAVAMARTIERDRVDEALQQYLAFRPWTAEGNAAMTEAQNRGVIPSMNLVSVTAATKSPTAPAEGQT